MVLHLYLYGRAKILGDAIDEALLCSKDGVDAEVDAIYKMGPLSVASAAYSNYARLISIRKSPNAAYTNHENMFNAALTKLNSNGVFISVPDTLVVRSLIYNSNIDPSQHLDVMSAAVSSVRSFILTQSFGTDTFLSVIKYDTLAAVVCQCNDKNLNSYAYTKAVPSMAAWRSGPQIIHCSRKENLSPAMFADLKPKPKCRSCGMYGHRVSEHALDGRLPSTVKPASGPSDKDAGRDGGGNKKVFKFNVAKLTDNQIDMQQASITIADLSHGALPDDGVSYAVLEIEELQLPAPTVLQDWSGTLDSIQKNLDRFTHWQYGFGQHNSPKTMPGSFVLPVLSDGGTFILNYHAVLEGLLQLSVGRNITKRADTLHKECNYLGMSAPDESLDFLTLKNHDMRSYIPSSAFTRACFQKVSVFST